MDEMVKLHWHCGYYVGAPKWHGTERYEPDECGNEFDTIVPKDEWDEAKDNEGGKLWITATCPACGSVLDAEYDEPNVVYVNSLLG